MGGHLLGAIQRVPTACSVENGMIGGVSAWKRAAGLGLVFALAGLGIS